MDAVTITIPGVPKGKGRPRFVRATGRTYTPAETASYEGMIRHEAALAMAGRPPVDEPVEMFLRVVVPVPASWSKKKRAAALAGELRPTGRVDLDNVMKAVSDACNGVVYVDDSRIVVIRASKVYGEMPGVTASFRRPA